MNHLQLLYIRVQQLKASFVRAQNIAAAWNHRHPWRFCSVSLLKIDGVDTSSTNVHPYTFVDGEFLQCKNIAAARNHGHPVRSDTLMIFRSGTDAASLNRSDVSALTETRRQKRTRKYAFDSATQ